MNKLHVLEFPKNTEKPEEKKVVDYLYIDADGDHVSLQFQKNKGDLMEYDGISALSKGMSAESSGM